MLELKLYAIGNEKHLSIIKQKYDVLKKAIKPDITLNANEKSKALIELKENFIKEKKTVDFKLF